MVTIARTYLCPGTDAHPAHQFRYLHHPNVDADPLPRFCGVCGFDSEGAEPEQAVTAPHIAMPIKATVDNMYRAMEEGSEHRANMAMEQFGLNSSEVSMMKITDMKDNLRSGDTSDMSVNNSVSQTMQQIEQARPGTVGFAGGANNGVGYSQTGHGNHGLRAMAQLRGQHAAFTGAAGHAGATTSSMPALETTNPGYRRRV